MAKRNGKKRITALQTVMTMDYPLYKLTMTDMQSAAGHPMEQPMMHGSFEQMKAGPTYSINIFMAVTLLKH